jgi:7-carboxy-7-deazaguanine synthase
MASHSVPTLIPTKHPLKSRGIHWKFMASLPVIPTREGEPTPGAGGNAPTRLAEGAATGEPENAGVEQGGPGGWGGRGLPITETFVSIQGEGKWTGVPSWFARLAGCNLRCRWCDTPYSSWKPESTPRTIDALVSEARQSGVDHAVVTGGEPLIFPQVSALTRSLRDAGLKVTIETAGTVFQDVHADLMSISPKLASSTPTEADALERGGSADWAGPTGRHEQRRVNLDALQRLIDAHPHRQLKFVVCGEADINEIESLLSKLSNWQPADILLMPEGTTPPTRELMQWLARECIARRWQYCTRLHVDIWGTKRGT